MFFGRLGIIVLVSLAAYLAYYTLKGFLLNKVKIDKWIVFTGALLGIFASRLIGTGATRVYSYILSGLVVMFLLWFYDLYNADSKKSASSNATVKPQKKSTKVTNIKKKN